MTTNQPIFWHFLYSTFFKCALNNLLFINALITISSVTAHSELKLYFVVVLNISDNQISKTGNL